MGENVTSVPSYFASSADIFAHRSASTVSNEHDTASGTGNIVLYPCITSNITITGSSIPFARRICRTLCTVSPFKPLRTEPVFQSISAVIPPNTVLPVTTCSSPSLNSEYTVYCVSCNAFSCNVIPRTISSSFFFLSFILFASFANKF